MDTLLAVASVTLRLLLLQSTVSVSQALLVEAFEGQFLKVGEVPQTNCWVESSGSTASRVRGQGSGAVFHRGGGPGGDREKPDRRHTRWASAEGSKRVHVLLLRTREQGVEITLELRSETYSSRPVVSHGP